MAIPIQNPGTAKGVVFLTLEDETEPIDVIAWPSVLERQRREVLTATLVGAYGKWQMANGKWQMANGSVTERFDISLRSTSSTYHPCWTVWLHEAGISAEFLSQGHNGAIATYAPITGDTRRPMPFYRMPRMNG